MLTKQECHCQACLMAQIAAPGSLSTSACPHRKRGPKFAAPGPVGRKKVGDPTRAGAEPMQLGRHLRELWRLRLGVAISFALALFLAVSSIAHVGLLPPKARSRQLEIAAASTRVLVDSPRSE